MIYTTAYQHSVIAVPSEIATVFTDRFEPFNCKQFVVLQGKHGHFLQGSTSQDTLRLEISNLYDATYQLKRPIPVELRLNDEGEFVASVEGANIAMTGLFAADALRLLREHVVALYTILRGERLGPEPQRQLGSLEKYIGEKRRQ
jgi:hypothetical protein